MNRRSFIKLVGAVLAVPALPVVASRLVYRKGSAVGVTTAMSPEFFLRDKVPDYSFVSKRFYESHTEDECLVYLFGDLSGEERCRMAMENY